MAIRIKYSLDQQILNLVNDIFRYQKKHPFWNDENTLKCFDIKTGIQFKDIIDEIYSGYDLDLKDMARELEFLIKRKEVSDV